MIQSVLTAVPTYPMTCFELPVSLCKRLQSAVTRYWWDSSEGTRKMAWISWNSMAQPKAMGGLGFRDFQNYNLALLAKIGWRLLHNPNCLLGRVLFSKYCQQNNILIAKEASAMSHGWRSILLGRDLLLENMGWLVGNGKSIQIWQDPWLNTCRKERPMGPVRQDCVDLRVSALMQEESCEWDLQKIRLLLPDYEEVIQRLKPSQAGAPDKMAWLGTRTGEYSVKSGYYAAVDRDQTRAELVPGKNFDWKKNVWNLDVAPKVKLFAWKLLKKALPVGERLLERHIPLDPLCKQCGGLESITHLFLHCPFAQQAWSIAPFGTTLESSGMVDLAENWTSIRTRTCLPPSGVISETLGIWILWNLWKARNKFVFEGHSGTPEDTVSIATVLAREWESSQKKDPPPSIARNQRNQKKQSPPGTMVIRSDAAWNHGGAAAGLGWVIHLPTDMKLFKSTEDHVSSPLMAEALALLAAVKEGAHEELQCVAFESDSTELIRAVNSNVCSPEIYGIVADILLFASVFAFVSFSWISRERNGQADMLAKSALMAAETDGVDGVIQLPTTRL